MTVLRSDVSRRVASCALRPAASSCRARRHASWPFCQRCERVKLLRRLRSAAAKPCRARARLVALLRSGVTRSEAFASARSGSPWRQARAARSASWPFCAATSRSPAFCVGRAQARRGAKPCKATRHALCPCCTALSWCSPIWAVHIANAIIRSHCSCVTLLASSERRGGRFPGGLAPGQRRVHFVRLC